jgi:hypothetical protein
MASRVRVNESTSAWIPEKTVDADAKGIAPLMARFDQNYQTIKALSKENDDIKEQLKLLGKNVLIKVAGQDAWRVRKDGAFQPALFAQDYPATAAEFTRMVMKPVLDLDALRAAQPMLYEEYRTQRLEKIK